MILVQMQLPSGYLALANVHLPFQDCFFFQSNLRKGMVGFSEKKPKQNT